MNQQRLKELLSYDPDTGVFTHILARRGVTVGSVAGYKNSDGYNYIILDAKKYVAHRLIWMYLYGQWPANQLDHINRLRHDNRICNLREVTISENRQNLGLDPKNKSGFRGVSFDNLTKLWRANISINGKAINLGRYSTAILAAQAYSAGAKKYHTHNSMVTI